MKPKRLIIIGLDGVPIKMLEGFAKDGTMPNVDQLIQEGFLSQMRSAIPEVSSVAWPSIITGANPGQHGIFGFTDLQADSYNIKFPNFTDLKTKPFWNCIEEKTIIMNVPSTYPVKDMNGIHISGFVSIDINKSVHPTLLIPELEQMDYRLDIDTVKAHSDLDFFLDDLDKSLTARIKTIDYLWEYLDWKAFMAVFTGTDRLMHFLFDAYQDKDNKYHNDFLNHFKRIDEAIGKIITKISDNDTLILLSDHGFEKLETDVYINNLLRKEGLLNFNPSELKLENINTTTKAFVLDPARIYLNMQYKYPNGRVLADEKESLLQQLENLFSNFEVDGKKVIKHIFKKESAYTGPYTDNGPDMILVGEKGFNLKGALAFPEITGKGPFSGKHTYEDAFFLSNKKDVSNDLKQNDFSVIEAGKLIKSILKS